MMSTFGETSRGAGHKVVPQTNPNKPTGADHQQRGLSQAGCICQRVLNQSAGARWHNSNVMRRKSSCDVSHYDQQQGCCSKGSENCDCALSVVAIARLVATRCSLRHRKAVDSG